MGGSTNSVLESDTVFVDVTFTGLSIESGDLAGREFQNCTFRRCKLPESRWTGTRLEDCRFEDCDLARMFAKKLALRGVVFKDTRLMGVDWSDLAPLPDIHFEGCDLRYSSFVKMKLRKTRFVGCAAAEASFIDVDLTETTFQGTAMAGVTFQRCVLTKADLAGATGLLFDPGANLVKGARVDVDFAVALVQAAGMVVAGYEER
jgi:fluoroquinolone resistance protein